MYCNNNKKYKCFTAILYVCLLNIVINNVSLSNEDIISKQEFQKLLDIKHITSLKKIPETVFELMDDKEEVKPTIANAGMKDNKGLDDRTTGEMIGDDGEREETKKTDKGTCDYIDFDKMDELADRYVKSITNLMSTIKSDLNDQGDFLELLVHFANSILKWIPEHEKKIESLRSTQPTKQEIAEIVNNAISSYNEANKKNTEELNKKIDETNKQSVEESNLYQAQMIQMLKDLTNKVDRLESVVSQKIDIINKQENSEVSGKSGIVRATKVNMEDFRILGAGLGNLVSEDTQAEEAEEK